MRSLTETIVAPITAVGGAVALVRVSGPNAWNVAQAVANHGTTAPAAAAARYVQYRHGDDGLALFFADGHGFTGEPSVELSCHGSRAAVEALLAACHEAGAVPAQPGEFTYRAFMNGKLDLTQAEGVRDSVTALTDAQLRHANRLRDGELKQAVRSARGLAVKVLGAIEASTDFSEEIGELDRPKALTDLTTCCDTLDRLLEGAERSWKLVDGMTVAILGLPNAGKSSLLNAILGADRAIVTDVPGTTRDTVEEVCDVQGVPVRFIDTAGLRASAELVERLGIERSLQSAENADHVFYVYDASLGWTDADEAELAKVQRPVTVIANKCDLPTSGPQHEGVRVSATTGECLAQALEVLLEGLDLAHPPLPNRRHAPLLTEAKKAVVAAIETISQDVPDDLAAVHLRCAVRCLGEVTGESASPDIIEQVFRDFCIGK